VEVAEVEELGRRRTDSPVALRDSLGAGTPGTFGSLVAAEDKSIAEGVDIPEQDTSEAAVAVDMGSMIPNDAVGSLVLCKAVQVVDMDLKDGYLPAVVGRAVYWVRGIDTAADRHRDIVAPLSGRALLRRPGKSSSTC
jgi:hypothetical protein